MCCRISVCGSSRTLEGDLDLASCAEFDIAIWKSASSCKSGPGLPPVALLCPTVRSKRLKKRGRQRTTKGRSEARFTHVCCVSVDCVGTFIDTCPFVLFAPGPSRMRSVNFRSVVVDECAQATEPEVVLCMLRRLDAVGVAERLGENFPKLRIF